MKVALYARVATDGPGDTRAALHIESLRAHAIKQGFDVVEPYVCCDIGHSGTSLDRPGLNRLLHGVQAKAFDAVVIMSPDRLSRNGGDLTRMIQEFEECGVAVVFVEDGLRHACN